MQMDLNKLRNMIKFVSAAFILLAKISDELRNAQSVI